MRRTWSAAPVPRVIFWPRNHTMPSVISLQLPSLEASVQVLLCYSARQGNRHASWIGLEIIRGNMQPGNEQLFGLVFRGDDAAAH